MFRTGMDAVAEGAELTPTEIHQITPQPDAILLLFGACDKQKSSRLAALER
jgi:hypothetical protein